VLNQPPPIPERDVLNGDSVLTEALTAFGGDPAAVAALGLRAGSAPARRWAQQADANTPTLHTHDRYGNRIDEVEFHPAWHELMSVAVSSGLHASPWVSDRSAAHVERAAGFASWYQVEAGHGCPISMTYAAVPALRADPTLTERYLPGLASREYDFGLRPASEKAGLIAGMAMTEKQGGSDVRANTTEAIAVDGGHLLTGHKWFCSADVGLVPGVGTGAGGAQLLRRPPGTARRQSQSISNPTTQRQTRQSGKRVLRHLIRAHVRRTVRGPRSRVRTIVEMVSATRLDCVLGSAALMRAALTEAGWHAAHRSAFGRPLLDQPLMRTVLTDLAVEVEASQWLGLRLAAAVDRGEDAFRRIALPMSKYYVCKRAPGQVFEAMECIGGSGYVEESGLQRLYREAPVNSIWEGSGSINALDLLRALATSPESLTAWLTEIEPIRGVDAGADRALVDGRMLAWHPRSWRHARAGWPSRWLCCCSSPNWSGMRRRLLPRRSSPDDSVAHLPRSAPPWPRVNRRFSSGPW
jgi:putative acyl-CoA dehydrogenase